MIEIIAVVIAEVGLVAVLYIPQKLLLRHHRKYMYVEGSTCIQCLRIMYIVAY